MRHAALLLALTSAAAGRTTVDVSFGWRFLLGPGAGGAKCDANAFPINITGQRVMGLSQAADAHDAASCEAAACANYADLWQWCVGGGAACGAASCWIGAWPGQSQAEAGWVSSRTNGTAPVPVPPEAAPGWDDSKWDVVDAPHDFEVSGVFSPNANGGEGFLPYNLSLHRKRLFLPASFSGSRIELYVEGALSASAWYLNGVPIGSGVEYMSGYTALILRLDNTPGIVYGGVNVICAFVDGTKKTGWFYEGAGLYRRVWLTAAPMFASIARHGVAAPGTITGAISRHDPNNWAAGQFADSIVSASVVVRNDAATGGTFTVAWALQDSNGATVATATSPTQTFGGAGSMTVAANITLRAAELWSVARPYLYTLVTSIMSGSSSLDSVNSTIGIRQSTWDANQGYFLNGAHVKMRGFCNHESFGGIGAAIPARVDLLRVQQMRGLGGNAWRTSHNAPEPSLLDITDRLGILVMDENRVFMTTKSCPGCSNVPTYSGDPVQDMADMVARDKLHASVIWWSFCNEAGCGDGRNQPAIAFRNVSYLNDGSRAVGANMGWISPMTPSAMSAVLDVMGFSHADANTVAKYHSSIPNQPLVMSECCSCETQRNEDPDQPYNKSVVYFSDEASGCLSGETQRSNAVDFNAGTFIWTLHDYLGEPGNWPHVTSSFGSIDVAGFPKAASFWLRSWWLSHIDASDAGRPPLPMQTTATTVYIVEQWTKHGSGANTRNIHIYSNAPYVRLFVNGMAFNAAVTMPAFGMVTVNNVPYTVGNITAVALSTPNGAPLAQFTRKSWGAAAAIALTCDAPSPSTGTGSALYLDGTDAALLRASIVDAAGNVVGDSTLNITFAVTAGPGFIMGTSNGDPASHYPNAAPWKPAYHGLVRAVIKANLVAVGDRALLQQINPEAGMSAASAQILAPGNTPPTTMTISATAPGLPPTTFTINLSVDPKDEVLAVAAANVGAASAGE